MDFTLPIGNIGDNPFTSPGGYLNFHNVARSFWEHNEKATGTYIPYDNTIDDYSDIINETLTLYDTVVLGDNLTQVFQTKKPIYMKPNKRLYNRSTIFNADAIIVDITQDAPVGTKRFYVSSVAGFKVGMFVSCSSTDVPVQGGGTGQTRRFARKLGLITNIGSNYIDTELGVSQDMLVASSAKFFTYNPTVLFYEINNSYLVGGIVDGNKDNQYDAESDAISPAGGIVCYFETTSWCGITGRAIIKNGISANISVLGDFGTDYDSNTNMFFDCISRDPHDKGMLLGRCNNVTIPYFEATGSPWEDGLITYVYCKDIRIGTLIVKDNGRFGFANNNLAKNITVDTLIAEDNGVNLHHTGLDLKIGKAILRGGGRYKQSNSDRGSIQFDHQYNAGGNVQIGMLEIDTPISTRIIRMIGNVKDIQIGMVKMKDNGTPRIGWSLEGSTPGNAPENVYVLSCIYENVATIKSISEHAVNINIPD